ncbi:hypothetical protein [Paraburkholderia sp. J63]|uniref:hypothetical protein n=1 Tax=Paraburkholderia sp. J63 TaxID=2805434 RepID=UPI002ABD6D75|nr:hypothetical protein [Paraburkholderia sp. J63]
MEIQLNIHMSSQFNVVFTKAMNQTLEILIKRYGAVMTLNQLAIALDRKPEGLRMSLLAGKEPWARELSARKIYVGRRMYFPVDVVAALLMGALRREDRA